MKKQTATNHFSWLALYVFIFIVLIILLSGFFYFQNQKKEIYTLKWGELESLALNKSDQISNWQQSYYSQTEHIANDQHFASLINDFIQTRKISEELRSIIRSYYSNKNIITIRLFFPDGSLLLPMSSNAKNIISPELLVKAAKQRKIIYTDLEFNPILNRPTLDSTIPIMLKTGKRMIVIAVMQLTIDPARLLFPILHSDLAEMHSAEVYLVRKNGENVQYLTELHYQEEAPLKYSRSSKEETLPAAMAIRGIEGKIEGRDYRGAPVLGYIHPIPDSPWYLIAKIDLFELLRPLQQLQRVLFLILILLIFIAGIATLYFLEFKRRQTEAREHRMQREQQILVQRFDYLSKYANDVIFLLNDKFEIIEVNDRATDMYGYTREELLYKNAASLRPADDPITLAQIKKKFGNKDGIVYETRHQRKDGTVFPIEISLRLIKVDETTYFQGSIRDITQRKIAEENFKRLNRFYTVISSINEMVLRVHDRDSLFTKTCRIAVEDGKARMAWIGIVDPESMAVNVQACAGITTDYLESITVTADGSIYSQGPVGRAIHSGIPVICNDVANDPMMAPWRKKALECQYHSIAAIPIQLAGNTIGSFAIYSEVTNFFDENTAKLLSDIAADLSFALDYINKEEERRKTEISLLESEQKFRNLVEESLVGVYIIQNNRFVYANPKIAEIFGYTVEEVISGLTVPDVVAEEDRTLVLGNLAKRFSGEVQSLNYCFRGQKKDKSIIDIEVFGTRTEFLGQPAVIGTLLDITERRRTEQALREHEQLLSLTGEVAKVGGWQLDAAILGQNSAYIGNWTESAALIHDLDPAKTTSIIDGMGCYSDISRDQIRTALRKAIESSEPFNIEVEMTTALGNHKWVCIIGKPVIENDKVVQLIGSVQDISERKKAEQDLNESESKFRSLVEESLVGVYIIQDDQFVYSNPKICEMFGYSEEEMLGMPVTDMVTKKDCDFVIDNLARRYSGEMQSLSYTFHGQKKDKTILDVEVYSSRIEYKGKPAVIGTAMDITERKLTENRLKDTNTWLEHIIEFLPDAVVIADKDDKIVAWNRAMEELTGLSKAAMMGKDHLEAAIPFYGKRRSLLMDLVRMDDQELAVNYSNVKRIGSILHAEAFAPALHHNKGAYVFAAAGPLFDREGNIVGVIESVRDITKRKQAEDAIQKSEEKFRLLIEKSLVGVYIIQDGKFVYVNPKKCEIFGYTKEEMIGLPMMDTIYKEDQALMLNTTTQRYEGKILQKPYTFRGVKKDGTVIDIEVIGSRIEYNGRPALIGTLMDVTERKRSEKTLQESEARYRFLFEHNPGMMLIYERDTFKILAINDAFRRHYGYTNEEALKLLMPDLFYPEEEQRRISELAPHLHGFQNVGEWHNRKKDGTVITIIASSHDLNYMGQNARVASITDITAHKLAEEALRDSENRYRALFETMTQGVIYQDKDGRVISANPAAEQILGLTLNELKKLPDSIPGWKAIHEDGSNYPIEEQSAVIALRTGHPVRNQLIGINNPRRPNTIWVDMDSIPQISPGELFPHSVFTTFSDISAKREAELALIKSERETRLLLDSMIEGLLQFEIIYDESGEAVDYQVIEANPASESITGLKRSDIIGKKASEVLPGIRPPYLDLIASIAVTGQAQLVEGEFKELKRWYRVSAFSPVRGRCAIVYQDITEEKQWENTLRESEERLRLALNATNQGLFDINLQTGTIIVTPEYARMLGYDPIDFHETREFLLERMHPDDRALIDFTFSNVSADTNPDFTIEFRQRTAQGNYIWIRSTGSFIEFDKQDKPLRLLGINIDITGAREAEAALRENEERLRLALSAANQGLFDINFETGEIITTPDFARLMGYDPDAFHEDYNSWLERMHPDDREITDDLLKKFRNSKQSEFRAEYRQRKADGSYAWILSIGKVIEYDPDGTPLRLLGTDIDITARKAADAALYESEERFRGLYENATIGIYRTTPDGKILMANPACVRMLGFDSFEELATRNLEEWGLISTIQRQQFRELIEKENVITGIESTWLRKDGSVFHVLESARIVRDENNQVMYYDGTFEDITERKMAELALQETHTQYRQALTQARAVPYLRYYYQDNYAFIGEEIIKYTGYPASEFRPQLWLKLRQTAIMLGDSTGMTIETAGKAFRSGKITHWLADYQIITRAGETHWLNDSAVPINDQNGKVIGSLGVLQDITERKHAEEVIRDINRELEQRVIQRTAQLEAANKELEAFSYSVSHDLRAPLRAIDGFANILLEDYKNKLDPEGQRLFNVIRDNAQKMGQLISDLLEFSRTGRKEISFSTVDLNQIFKEQYAEMIQNQPRRTIKFNAKRLPKVVGDASLLKIVVNNLLSNAIKYTRKTPTARINVGYKKEANFYIFSVSDNGVGFDMRYADKLFGVFQRLHTDQEFEGTGVGLALIQRIIHKHGGQVWAEGQVGRGATFYFSLPVTTSANPEAQA